MEKPDERTARASRLSPKSVCWAIALWFGVLGGCFLGAAGWSRWHHHALETRGTVVQASVGAPTARGNGSSPTFEYSWQGQPFRWVSPYSWRAWHDAPGSKVVLYVDPQSPSDVAVDDFAHRWLLAIILGMLGAAFIAGSAIASFLAWTLGRTCYDDSVECSSRELPMKFLGW